MHNSLVAQSPAEESVRKWYLAFSKLDSAGFFNFWATNHKNFVYVADGNVLKRDDFLKRMTGILQNTKQVLKADILEGYPYEISNNTESYTAKVLLEGIYTSGISFSTTVTATFVLRKIHGQWKCVQCSASHIRIQSERK
jgi:ketosteroid isomerase-like protein